MGAAEIRRDAVAAVDQFLILFGSEGRDSIAEISARELDLLETAPPGRG
jgi:hypothetical protein